MLDTDYDKEYYQPIEIEELEPKEFVFILDRSGSMWGTPINVAKEALKLFVKSLPEGSYFNVISFGSTFQPIFQTPVEYSNSNVEYVLEQLTDMDADLGGTEIYQPLFSALSKPVSDL